MPLSSSLRVVDGFDSSGRTSSEMTLEAVKAIEPGARDTHGLSVTVPGAVDCWMETLNSFGSGQVQWKHSVHM